MDGYEWHMKTSFDERVMGTTLEWWLDETMCRVTSDELGPLWMDWVPRLRSLVLSRWVAQENTGNSVRVYVGILLLFEYVYFF